MENKYSKGQWVKGTNTSKRDWMQIYCDGKMIAEVTELSKKGQRKASDFDEEAANCQLIAAAPDMLSVLREAVDHSHVYDTNPALIELFNAVIQKATS